MMRVTAVLLAAGLSNRFGAGNKLLAEIAGEPMVRRVARQLANSKLYETIVVTGPDRDAIVEALAGIPLRDVHNQAYQSGMGGSIAAGVRALGPETDGVLIVPGDMPALTPGLIDKLIAVFAANGGAPITHPVTVDGNQRNPVLWPARRFSDLVMLEGELGAKALIAADPLPRATVTAGDETAFEDVDTQEDLARFSARS
jgi:molybdenum cofactor cytidylyltransferase